MHTILKCGLGERVLIVEDDEPARLLMSRYLEQRGYETVAVENGAEAIHRLREQGAEAFSCVVTDFWMPSVDGLGLLTWLNRTKNAPAAVIVSAGVEKAHVEELLRQGAVDFLSKPLRLVDFAKSVANAIKNTAQRRSCAALESEVIEVARTHRLMLNQSLAGNIAVLHHPKHLVGGDSAAQFDLGGGRHAILLTDVSGHDLNAAFASAYFQGVVRGMLTQAMPMDGVLRYFNTLLLGEGQKAYRTVPGEVALSVTACAMLVDAEAQSVTVYRCGSCLPAYVDEAGGIRNVGFGRSYPLGWFEEFAPAREEIRVAEGGAIYVWTDGLEDYASVLEVSSLSLVYRLMSENAAARAGILAPAQDDVLVVRIGVGGEEGGGIFAPLLIQHYAPEEVCNVDRMQAYWERSLQLALPAMPEDQRQDLLLCAREAILNALQHGCGPGELARITISYRADSSLLRLIVEDARNGHGFDLAARQNGEPDADGQRGLLLMHSLSHRIRSDRNGACVTMDWVLGNDHDAKDQA